MRRPLLPILTSGAVLTAVVWLSAAPSAPPAQTSTPERVTFSEHIAPILYDNCVTCHRPGEAAPFPLISYEDASKRAKLIALFTDGWQLGQPDLVLEMPEAFEVPADGPDLYRNFAIPTGIAEDKWIRAVE